MENPDTGETLPLAPSPLSIVNGRRRIDFGGLTFSRLIRVCGVDVQVIAYRPFPDAPNRERTVWIRLPWREPFAHGKANQTFSCDYDKEQKGSLGETLNGRVGAIRKLKSAFKTYWGLA